MASSRVQLLCFLVLLYTAFGGALPSPNKPLQAQAQQHVNRLSSQSWTEAASSSSYTTIPPSIRLFGNRVAPGVTLSEVHASLDPHVDHFPPRRFQLLTDVPVDRHVARVLAEGITGGDSRPLKSDFLDALSVRKLSDWSDRQFRDPASEFYFYIGGPVRRPNTIYLVKPIPMHDFQHYILHHGSFDEQAWQAWAMYRTAVGQKDFVRGGVVQILGVELMHRPELRLVAESRPMLRPMQLRHLFHYIEHGI